MIAKPSNSRPQRKVVKSPSMPTKFRRTSMLAGGVGGPTVCTKSFSSQMLLNFNGYLNDIVDDLDLLDDLDNDSNKQAETHKRLRNVRTQADSSANIRASDAEQDDELSADLYAEFHHEFVDKPLYAVTLNVPTDDGNAVANGGLSAATDHLSQFSIQVLQLKLDGLAATCRVPIELRDGIVKAALEHTKQTVLHGVRLRKAFVSGGTRYAYNLDVCEVGPDGKHRRLGLIQLKPGNTRHAYLRIELNPSAIGSEGCGAFKGMLKVVLGKSARKILAKAKITLLDVAVDILGIPINALLLYSDRVGDSLVWGRHYDRNLLDRLYILTQQIGSKKSCTSLIIYDKREERRSKGKSIKGQATRPCVRAEGRIRPKVMVDGKLRHGIYLAELNQLPNPLADLNISVYFPPKKKDWMFSLFLDATQQIGTEAALAKVSRASRPKYRALLKSGAVDWWRPTEIIANVPAALKATGLFPPEAFR